MRLEAYSEIER